MSKRKPATIEGVYAVVGEDAPKREPIFGPWRDILRFVLFLICYFGFAVGFKLLTAPIPLPKSP